METISALTMTMPCGSITDTRVPTVTLPAWLNSRHYKSGARKLPGEAEAPAKYESPRIHSVDWHASARPWHGVTPRLDIVGKDFIAHINRGNRAPTTVRHENTRIPRETGENGPSEAGLRNPSPGTTALSHGLTNTRLHVIANKAIYDIIDTDSHDDPTAFPKIGTSLPAKHPVKPAARAPRHRIPHLKQRPAFLGRRNRCRYSRRRRKVHRCP